MDEITVGAQYRLRTDFGTGPGMVPAGAVVTVLGIYPPGTPGVGAIDEDTVLCSYHNAYGSTQHLALGVTLFASMFEEVSG
ncbi:hypothetical protein ACWDTT_10610 [Streptosporangium sandarakinum]